VAQTKAAVLQAVWHSRPQGSSNDSFRSRTTPRGRRST
jgi:hypothetical protein